MKNRHFSAVAFALILASGLVLPGSTAAAQEIKVEDVSFQTLIGQLFGTTEAPGLLDGTSEFHLHAENITMTTEEADAFFVPTAENTSDLVDLITAAEGIRGAELKLEGLLDGEPFEFKLSGKQIKLEGIVLTDAELDTLIQELQGISGLREAKIEAIVDGEMVVVKLENKPGRVKIEGRNGPHVSSRQGRDAGVELANRVERSERPERPEKAEKIERLERLERIERPDHGRR